MGAGGIGVMGGGGIGNGGVYLTKGQPDPKADQRSS